MAIEPKSRGDGERLGQELERIAAEDPGLRFSIEPESGQIRLGGSSERHLDAVVEKLGAAGIAMNVGAFQVAYREILSGPVEANYTHARQTGATNQFARVLMRFEPNSRSMSNTFAVAEQSSLSAEYHAGVEKGFRSLMASGPLIGFPIVACHATLIDGAHHDVDSSPLAFEIATRAAFREAVPETAVKLLEPYLEIDITVPDSFTGSVVGDFKSRRGVNTLKEASPGVAAIYGFAPLANMFGFEARLASLTQGKATYSWRLAGLEEVPAGKGPDTFSPAAAKRG